MVRPGRDLLTGRVEVDETYLGGLEEGLRGRFVEKKALTLERNPWALLPAQELISRGLTPPPDPAVEPRPGPFALGQEWRVRELLEQAGFADVQVEGIDLARRHEGFEDLWDSTLDLSRS